MKNYTSVVHPGFKKTQPQFKFHKARLGAGTI